MMATESSAPVRERAAAALPKVPVVARVAAGLLERAPAAAGAATSASARRERRSPA